MNIEDIETITPTPYEKPLEPGEYYVGQRNGPAVIAICRKHDQDMNCVFAESFGLRPEGGGLGAVYPYNTFECRRISKETYDKMAQQVNIEHKKWLTNFWKKVHQNV